MFFFCNINHCNDSTPCWDLDWTIQYYLILTVSWYCIVQYPVKTGKFTYNCITTMNFLTNFTITKFCLRLTIQKSSFCSRNSNVYICQRVCIFFTSYNFETNAVFVISLVLKNSLKHTHEKWTLPVP